MPGTWDSEELLDVGAVAGGLKVSDVGGGGVVWSAGGEVLDGGGHGGGGEEGEGAEEGGELHFV